jgi:hypothetical protein
MSFGLNSFKQQGSKQEEIELEKKLLEGDILRLTKVGIYELVIEKIALSVITFTNKENACKKLEDFEAAKTSGVIISSRSRTNSLSVSRTLFKVSNFSLKFCSRVFLSTISGR